MKRAKSRSSHPAAKGAAVPKTVDEYLERVPEPARTTLKKVRVVIRSVVPPETTEVLSYRIPTFKHKRAVVAYAAFSNHCSLFPLGSSAIRQFANELKGYQVTKGTIHFPLDKPLPAALLKKIVKARLANNERRERD